MQNYNPYSYNNFNSYQNTYSYVNGLEGAKAYQVMPNQTTLLIDSENPVIYMKTANAMGQSTMQCFKIAQISENDIRGNDNTPYAAKDDLNALIKRIEALESNNKEVKNESSI